jgi:PST family polysaccharide transporter
MNSAASSTHAMPQAAPGTDPRPAAVADSPKTSYGQILRSSALIGGASVLTILVGIVRTKAMALMLGPAGFGLMGAFMAILDLVCSIASMGINRSGVRQIAESVGTGDTRRIAVTVIVLRRTAVVLGIVGAVLLALLAAPIAQLSFGHAEYAAAIALLALAVFFRLVAEGQSALIQGMRRIADFAKISILGAAFGAVAAIPLVYFLRERGVALAIVAAAVMTVLTSWWYSRKVRVDRVQLTAPEFRQETKVLLQLGIAFMVSGLLMMGAAYIVRVILLRFEGLEATGLYQAAWTLGGMYVGLILQAMGADFYPRLVAAAKDDAHCNRLVNEQTQVSLLLASSGVLATLVLAPFVLTLFYSSSFSAAAEALRWICLGMALRVLTWPMGYIIIAKGDQRLFILTELAWTVVNLGLSYAFVRSFGLAGAGIAFFLSYLFHAAMIYPIVRRLSGFRFDNATIHILVLSGTAAAVAFVAFFVLPSTWASAVGMLVLLLGSAVSVWMLLGLFPKDAAPRQLRWLFALVRPAR